MVVVACGDEEVATWPLADLGPVGLPLIDALARLQLAARRLGLSIRLRGARGDLVALLELTGLGDAVLKVVGETEDREEIGVEEVVVPDDPIA
jgi:hypothetical protein